MDLIPTFRTAELIMSRNNPFTSDYHDELVISMSVWQCDWAEKRQKRLSGWDWGIEPKFIRRLKLFLNSAASRPSWKNTANIRLNPKKFGSAANGGG